MSISRTDLKALLQKSGNRCAFPQCPEALHHLGAESDDIVILSEIAHIVAQKLEGPRGSYPLPLSERDKESNLILLCEKHHTIVDTQFHFYTVERLRQMKEDHESRVAIALGLALGQKPIISPPQLVQENLFSTLFPVVTMPTYVYGAPLRVSTISYDEIRKAIVFSKDNTEMYPFILKEGCVYAFQDLGAPRNPFSNIIKPKEAQQYRTRDWWDDADKIRWFVSLMNSALNKLTGRKHLQWDKEHSRYYFQPDVQGEVKEIAYRPLNQASTTRQVVWQPIAKKTGEPRPFWLHQAVNLRFHRIRPAIWCLSIRPEFHVTKDGLVPEDSERIGAQVTRKKSKMFNYDYLGEVNFWRDFLGDSQPRIILNFGPGQHAIIETSMIETQIFWPGMPEKYAMPFKNVGYVEDLFSWAKLVGLDEVVDTTDDAEDEDWEEERIDQDE